jgi:hypothetical protein
MNDTEAVRMDEDLEGAIDEALGGNPRASEIAPMVAALEQRRATIAAEPAVEPVARTERQRKLNELDRQINVLREDMAISGFIEDSVRVAVTRQLLEQEVG